MSEPSTQSTQSGLPKIVSMLALFAFIGVFLGVRDAGSVDVWGVSLPVWALSLGMYLLGAVAMWGAAGGSKK